MSIEPLIELLPEYARDLGQNLKHLAEETCLSDQRKWGTFLASACATGEPRVTKAAAEAATAGGLSEEASRAARAAAAIMGMNNVYYRTIHLLENREYQTLPAKLRMNIIANPGVDKTDFELWCLAVSAINACAACLDAHEEELKKRAVPAIQVQASLRIAAVIVATARVLGSEGAPA